MAMITTNDHHYHAIANAIRENAGTDRTYKPEEMPLGVGHAYSAGFACGYNMGVEDGETNGKNISNQWWIDFIKGKTNLDGFFKEGKFETIPDGLDFSNVTSMGQTFYTCSNLKRLPFINSTNCTYFGYAFGGIGQVSNPLDEVLIDMRSATDTEQILGSAKVYKWKLLGDLRGVKNAANMTVWSAVAEIRAYEDETMAVEIPLDLSSNTKTSVFAYNNSLRYVRVAPGSIKVSQNVGAANLLEDGTIQSIIDGLADLTGATAQTLTLHADVGAKLTQAQKDAVSAKNWTLVY